MREIVTRVWCDVCAVDSLWTEAEEVPPVVIGNWKPRVLALCERHEKELFAPFRDVLSDHGQVVPADLPRAARAAASKGAGADGTTRAAADARTREHLGGSRDAELSCPICEKAGDPPYVTRDRGRMREHTSRIHDTKLAAIETELGHTLDGLPLRFTCAHCGLGFSHGQGLATHERIDHPRTARAASKKAGRSRASSSS